MITPAEERSRIKPRTVGEAGRLTWGRWQGFESHDQPRPRLVMACDQSEKVHLFQNFLSLAPTILGSVGEPSVTPTSSGWLGGTFKVVGALLGFLRGGGLRVLWGRMDGGVGMALDGFAGSILAVERGFFAGEGLARLFLSCLLDCGVLLHESQTRSCDTQALLQVP